MQFFAIPCTVMHLWIIFSEYNAWLLLLLLLLIPRCRSIRARCSRELWWRRRLLRAGMKRRRERGRGMSRDVQWLTTGEQREIHSLDREPETHLHTAVAYPEFHFGRKPINLTVLILIKPVPLGYTADKQWLKGKLGDTAAVTKAWPQRKPGHQLRHICCMQTWVWSSTKIKSITGHIGDWFYGSNEPTNSVKAQIWDRVPDP